MKRAVGLAVPLASLLLVVAACGDDDDGPDTSTAVSTPEATDLPGGDSELTLPDLSLPDLTLPGGTLPGGGTLPDLSDITIPGNITIPDISENAEAFLAQIFPKLSDDQISCLADQAGDLSGETVKPSDFTSYLSDCDIEPADLLPG
ncbi:MAG: hypothetical protein ABW328_16695 [Ilumatobacteraceae bacterium]